MLIVDASKGVMTGLLKKVHESSDSPYDVVLCIGMESIFGEVFAEDAFELFVQSEAGSFAFEDREQSSAGFVFDQYLDLSFQMSVIVMRDLPVSVSFLVFSKKSLDQ